MSPCTGPIPRRAWAVEFGLAMVVAVVVAAAPGRAQEGGPSEFQVTVTVHEPFSPYARVVWELKRIGGTPAVAVTREHVGGYGTQSEVEIVSEATFEALRAATGPCFAVDGDPTAPRPGEVAWVSGRAVEGPTVAEWTVAGAFVEGDASRCVEALRAAILEIVSVEPYAVPFWDEGEYGTLRATSSLPAHLWVDGRPTGLVTPVNALRLDPGTHTVRWVGVASGQEESRAVLVVEGTTTAVDVRF